MLYFTIQNRLQDGTSKVPEAAGCEMTILSSDYRRIMLGLSSDYPRIVFLLAEATSGSFRWNLELQDFVAGAVFGEVGGWLYWLLALEMRFHMWRRSLMTFILRGRRSIWWSWRVALVAPRIGNDVSYVTQIIDDIHFAWQARYLVKLEGGSCCSARWKWCFILRGRRSIWWSWTVTLVAPRIVNDVAYVMRIIDDIHFARQAQYLVKLDGDSCCAAHCTWRFKVVPE